MSNLPDTPAFNLRPPPMVGRDREQAVLRDLLAEALIGRGNLVLIGGTAGIGKSALVGALAHQADELGALAFVGSAHEQTETPPYGPWAELISRSLLLRSHPLAPASMLQPDTPETSSSPTALLTQLRDLFFAVARECPLILVLEDIHWADAASLDLLRFLSRQLAQAPILLLATYRDDEVARDHPLFGLLPILVREAYATRLHLHPLNRDDVRALVQARYRMLPLDEDRLVAYLVEHAEGNPFFSSELLRAFAEESLFQAPDSPEETWVVGEIAQARIPALLRQVIDIRLDRLGADARGLLEIAAIIGQEVPLALWAEICAISETALLELVDRTTEARILEELAGGTRARFVHALISEVLYAELAPSRRRRLHQQVGEALAAKSNPEPDAVAHHFRQAGDPRAIQWLVRAGERAHRLYAWQTAADRLDVALGLMEESEFDPGERGWLGYRAARLRRYANPELSIAGLHEAERLGVTAGDPVLAAYALSDRGTLHCFGIDLRRGLSELEEGVSALDSLAESGNPRLNDQQLALWVADALPAGGDVSVSAGNGGPSPAASRKGALTIWLAWAGRFEEARTLGERLTKTMRPESSSAAEWIAYGDAYLGLAIAHGGLGHPEEARRAFRTARDLFVKAEHVIGVAHTGLIELLWAVVPYQADRLAERRQIANEAVAAWTRASGAVTGPFGAQLPLLLLDGHWGEAVALAMEVNAANMDRPVVELVILACAQGNTDLIEQLSRVALPAGSATEPGGCPFLTGLELLRAEASIAVAGADFESARGWLEAHDRWLSWSGGVLGQSEGQLAWATSDRALGDSISAREHAQRALASATLPRQPLALLSAHRLLGELDTTAGLFLESETQLDESLVLADACQIPYERALTLLAIAGLRGATGDRVAAHALLDEARAILTPLAASPALARAAALADQYPIAKRRGSGPADRLGLTPREFEVLQLLSQRWTDKEIAAALFVSPRTVSSHVTAILNKLGVGSRHDATAAALRSGLIGPEIVTPTA